MIETDAGQEAGGIQADPTTVPLTRQQVTDCFRLVMDLLTAQQLASTTMQEMTASLPANLLPEHRCTIEFLASVIDKVEDGLAGAVDELEILRDTLVRADIATPSPSGSGKQA